MASLVAADEDADERFVRVSVDFLVGHEGWHVDEVASSGFGDEFQIISPTHAGAPAEDIDDAFEFAVVVGAGFGIPGGC